MVKHNKEEVEDFIREAAKFREGGSYKDSLKIFTLISENSFCGEFSSL